MRRNVVLFLVMCTVFAQDAPGPRARELERRAEQLLDQGDRAGALKLLAEAADLRARGVPAEPERPSREREAEEALRDMERALAQGDVAAARKAGGRAHELLGAWEKDLQARERRWRERRAALPVEQRLDELERQVRELRQRIEPR
jgi:hypothetical protein